MFIKRWIKWDDGHEQSSRTFMEWEASKKTQKWCTVKATDTVGASLEKNAFTK